MRRLLPLVALGIAGTCRAADPACADWPANMAFVVLKDAGMIDESRIDRTKTQARRLASQRVGKDLYRQVHDITFHDKAGGEIEVLTSNEASSQECSMGSVDVFVVSRKLDSDAPMKK